MRYRIRAENKGRVLGEVVLEMSPEQMAALIDIMNFGSYGGTSVNVHDESGDPSLTAGQRPVTAKAGA